jgi:predicted RNA-binding protein (virulence factor B family)
MEQEKTSLRLGDYNMLTVTRLAQRDNPHSTGGKETFGLFLDGGREGEILMPKKYVPEGTKVGDSVRCFVYLDQEERLVATTETPLAKVGDFACLECTWVNQYGAFLNWGLMKDLFCPFREQKKKMEMGESYIVYIHLDEESYRIVATAKIDKYLASAKSAGLKERQEVDLLVWQKTDLGFKVIVNNLYQGLVYRDQIFQYIHTGDRLKGFVEKVRPDGKLDIILQPTGRRQTLDFADTLLAWIKSHDGFCPFGDKSAPDDIKRTFQVSKKVFKKAVGDLYKRHLITITDRGLQLTATAEQPSTPA